MRRYWAPKNAFQTLPDIHFQGDLFHHIFEVCRQDVGSHFEILGDGDKAHLVEVTQVTKKSATAQVKETRALPALPKPRLVLALSLSRYPTMDAVVEKAVEMGVARIQPFFSDFSFIRKKDSLPAGKQERWEKIVISATQQTGRGDLMSISEPVELSDLQSQVNQNPRAKGLFAYEGEARPDKKDSRQGLKDYLRSILAANAPDFEEFWVFVGSEGGFSPTEVQLFKNWGLEPVTLGDQVLRVETACIALLAVLKYEFGHMSAKANL
jgi:16S rRNA (uracil1498-N3)-methyltransferase